MERWATAGTHTLPDAKLEPAQSETSPRFGSAAQQRQAQSA
jgi:hypothetical protein